ncbi:MAG: AAA family ATPase, partial [Proteobacteria bacterium]|nr:AAA family ATPase [Pseudomonadota bacterium]
MRTKLDYLNIADLYMEAGQSKRAQQIVQKVEPAIQKLNQTPPPAQAQQGQPAKEEDYDFELADLMDHGLGVEQYTDTDLPVFNYKTLGLYLEFAYESKEALLIYGEPGLGKSTIVANFARNAAQSKGREYVFWNKAEPDKQMEVLDNPGKYFVLVDVRTAQLEPADLTGIPDIYSKTQYLQTRQPKWIWLVSRPDADGILFLDEINQGSPQVLKALFEVVLDRSAGGTYFSKNLAVIGAGNLDMEHGNEPIPPALTNRFTAGVLVADPESWLKWA